MLAHIPARHPQTLESADVIVAPAGEGEKSDCVFLEAPCR